MYTRRQFLVVAVSQFFTAPVLANQYSPNVESGLQTQRQHVLRAFSTLKDDPHIRTAINIALGDKHSNNNLPWPQLIEQSSGCRHTDSPDAILAGFVHKKNASLRNFRAKSINGYMLTEEELFLGQLLATE